MLDVSAVRTGALRPPPPHSRRKRRLYAAITCVALALAGGYTYAKSKVTAFLAGAGLGEMTFRLERLTRHEAVLADVSLDTAGSVTAARITARYTLGDLRHARVDTVEIEGLKLAATHDGTRWSLGALDRWTQGGGSGAAPALPFRVLNATEGRFTLKHPSLRTEMELPWNFSLDASTAPYAVRLDMPRVTLLDTLTFTTFTFQGAVSPSPLSVQGKIALALPPLENLAFEVAYDAAAQRFAATMPDKTFDLSSLHSLFPPPVTAPTGTVRVGGTAAWEAGKHRADVRLALRDVSFTASGIPVRGVAGTIAIDSLAPFRIAKPQRLTAKAVEVGVPVEDIAVTFRLPTPVTPKVDAVDFRLAGGKAHVDGIVWNPKTLQLDAARLTLADVPIQPLLDPMLSGKLQASGSVSGAFPLVRREGALKLEGGSLQATGEGTVVYHPDAAESAALAGSGQIVAEALKDFHYRRLRVGIEGDVTGARNTLQAKVEMGGRNPQLYGGQPIELTLTLRGDLMKAIRGALDAGGLANQVERSLTPK